MRIFISGHMDQNRPAFDAEASRLDALGHIVVTPFDLDCPSTDWAACMAIAIAEIRNCDAISLLPGWEYYAGPLIEEQAAVRFGLQIILAPMSEAYAMELVRAAVETDRAVGRVALKSSTCGGVR